MPDREKVIKGLEILTNGCECIHCEDCCFYVSTKPVRCGLREEEIREDALALLKEQETANLYKCQNCGTWVSAENVVRCKDCKAWKQYDDMNLGECELYPEYNKMGDWFCNFGERKEGGD